MRKEKLKELTTYLEELKTLQFRPIEGSSFLTSETYECHLKCGRVIVREKLLKGKKEGSAAIIFALTKSGEVLLNIEPRVFTKETVLLGFPSGYIEPFEQPEEGARRELLEEHGYQAGKMILLDSFYQDEGCSSAYNHIFLATSCERVGSQKLDTDEIIHPFLCTYEETLELEELGYFKSANSKLTLERVKQYQKGRL